MIASSQYHFIQWFCLEVICCVRDLRTTLRIQGSSFLHHQHHSLRQTMFFFTTVNNSKLIQNKFPFRPPHHKIRLAGTLLSVINSLVGDTNFMKKMLLNWKKKRNRAPSPAVSTPVSDHYYYFSETV
jgi:hypothetical protein